MRILLVCSRCFDPAIADNKQNIFNTQTVQPQLSFRYGNHIIPPAPLLFLEQFTFKTIVIRHGLKLGKKPRKRILFLGNLFIYKEFIEFSLAFTLKLNRVDRTGIT